MKRTKVYRWLQQSLLMVCIAASGHAAADSSPKTVVLGFTVEDSPVSANTLKRGQKTGRVADFCGEVQQQLEQQGFQVVLRELPLDQRFIHFARTLNGQVGVECGPFSKTRERERLLAMDAAANQYSAALSQPFWHTATKLLMREGKRQDLYQQPATVRIGVLQKPGSLVPVTSNLIAQVFPNAEIVGLPTKADALERLAMPASNPQAIDAYASDEVMLYDMLNKDIDVKQRAAYRIEPQGAGFSQEDYVLITYNDAALAKNLDQWLASPSTKQAAKTFLTVPRDTLQRMLQWLAQGQHVEALQDWLGRLLLLLGGMLLGSGWAFTRLWSAMRTAQQASQASVVDRAKQLEKDLFLHYSRELHDQVGSLVVSAKREFELAQYWLETEQPQSAHASLDQAKLRLDHLGAEVRRVAHEIRWEAYDRVDDLLQDFSERVGIATQRQGNVQWQSIPAVLAHELYCVMQQALANIERHAQASQVIVDLQSEHDKLQITISDNGRGFDVQHLSDPGIGLKNMRDRVKRLEGQFCIDSVMGKGTVITLTVPCEVIA